MFSERWLVTSLCVLLSTAMGSSMLLANSVYSLDDMPIFTAVMTGLAADTILGGTMANAVAQLKVYLAISIENEMRRCSSIP